MLEFIEVFEPSRIKTQVIVDSDPSHDKGVSAMLIIFQPDHPQILSPGHVIMLTFVHNQPEGVRSISVPHDPPHIDTQLKAEHVGYI